MTVRQRWQATPTRSTRAIASSATIGALRLDGEVVGRCFARRYARVLRGNTMPGASFACGAGSRDVPGANPLSPLRSSTQLLV
jgi:hypothetical protein